MKNTKLSNSPERFYIGLIAQRICIENTNMKGQISFKPLFLSGRLRDQGVRGKIVFVLSIVNVKDG
jgi:hypothetical protein